MAEVIRSPGMKDNPVEVESQALVEHHLLHEQRRAPVDNSPPEVRSHEAGIPDSVDMVDKRAGSEALLRAANIGTLIHVRDKQFVDQQLALA